MPGAHFGVSLAALRAGKHVFSEKPLAVDFEQGRTLVDEAEARGLLLGCAPDTFLGAGGRLARKLVDDGAVGRILSGTAFLMSHGMEHWHPDPEFFFKPGGGPILDMAPYYLSALVNLIGPVQRVHSRWRASALPSASSRRNPRARVTGIKVETADPCDGPAGIRLRRAGHLLHELGRLEARPSAIELYGSEGSLRVPDPNFFGGAGGDHRARRRLARCRFERHAARRSRTGARRTGRPRCRTRPTTAPSVLPISPAPS